MSKALCDSCGCEFDTEDDADYVVEHHGNADSFICGDCRQEMRSLDDPDWPDEGDGDTKYKLRRDNDA